MAQKRLDGSAASSQSQRVWFQSQQERKQSRSESQYVEYCSNTLLCSTSFNFSSSSSVSKALQEFDLALRGKKKREKFLKNKKKEQLTVSVLLKLFPPYSKIQSCHAETTFLGNALLGTWMWNLFMLPLWWIVGLHNHLPLAPTEFYNMHSSFSKSNSSHQLSYFLQSEERSQFEILKAQMYAERAAKRERRPKRARAMVEDETPTTG